MSLAVGLSGANFYQFWAMRKLSMAHIAVIDTETTGLFPHRQDRVVELAAVIMTLDGEVIREYETLINPRRDIGPTQVHGLVSGDIIHAPTFEEIIGSFIAAIDGCVAIAGHNIRFDHDFLESEFARCGLIFPDAPNICTMKLSGGGSLKRSCEFYGVDFGGKAHSARCDALASAKLLSLFLSDSHIADSELLKMPSIAWPDVPHKVTKLITRDSVKRTGETVPTFVQALIKNAQPKISQSTDNDSLVEYRGLLNQVLEDRVIDQSEGEALVDLAVKWGLGIEQVTRLHEEYLSQLADAAWADGIVTEAENRDLVQVSKLLGVNEQRRNKIFKDAKVRSKEPQTQNLTPKDEFLGKCVCFTGECQCVINGERVTRSMSYGLAEEHGMIAAKSVTKKLDFLVVADPYTQSGKAQKAKKYGTRVIQARVFWRALGLEVS